MTDEPVTRAGPGRRPDEIPSERIRIDGYRKRNINKRYDKTFEWLDAIPGRKRFNMVWELITAALNGELGIQMQTAIETGDLDLAKQAASQIVSAFVVDDDE